MKKIIFLFFTSFFFLILIQAPILVDNYEKGASHRYDELKIIMSKYDNIVETFFDGDRQKYINARINNSDESIKAEGIILRDNYYRLERLEKSLSMMSNKQTIEKAYIISRHGDYATIEQVIIEYKPNFSIHFEYAEYYGFSILISLFATYFLFYFFRVICLPFRKVKKNA